MASITPPLGSGSYPASMVAMVSRMVIGSVRLSLEFYRVGGGSGAPRCARSEIGPEGVGDDVSSTAQVIADDPAEDLSACGGGVHLADIVGGAGIGACLTDASADQGQGVGGGSHERLSELKSV